MVNLLIILTPVLAVAVATDIRYGKIFNWLTFPAMLAGLIYHLCTAGMSGGFLSIEGLFVGMACYLPFYVMGGTGAGDVKLMGAVGTFLGPQGVFYAFVYSTLVGGVYAVLLLMGHGLFRKTVQRYWSMVCNLLVLRKLVYVPPKDISAMPVLKYGIAIAVGTTGYIIHQIYLN